MQITYETDPLYKRDSKGGIRYWKAQAGSDGEKSAWRTITGLNDGKKITSEWKFVKGKNIGKSNETTPHEQSISEVKSNFKIKSERGYFSDISKVDSSTKFKPMLANGYNPNTLDFSKRLFSQPKLDGIRCIVKSDGMWTRSAKEISSCPHIFQSLSRLLENYPDLTLDGELYNHDLKEDFNEIVSMVRKTKPTEADTIKAREMVQYHIYDCHFSNTPDLTFIERMELLQSMVPIHSSLYVVETCEIRGNTEEEIDGLYANYLENGYEGQMIRLNGVYENKRSKNLLKRKEFITDEFEVVDVLEGRGNWAGYIKRFKLVKSDGTEFHAGVRGNQETLKEMLESEYKPDWATVRYFTPTPDGIPRFPVVVDWGKDERTD